MNTNLFDLRSLLAAHADEMAELHARHINEPFVEVLKTIGFNARYVRGQGAYLWDDQGRRYIDALGGYAVFNVGRNHPVVREALKQAMDMDLPNLPGVGNFHTAGLVAKQLCELAPGGGRGGLENVFFTSSGAEAIEAAYKFARAATGRERIIYCQRAYHGLTTGALATCGNHEFRDGFGALLQHVDEIPFNDLAALETALAGKQAAAFAIEPIQGKGVNIPSANYLREAQALCRKHGTLLIADEIQTGLGRTGKMFACEHFGLEPDMLVIAKGLSGGYVPVGAVLMPRRVNQAVYSSLDRCARIQTTFGMNELAMVAALATLHVLKAEKIVENARVVGDRLQAGLRGMIGRHQMVKDVRGFGLMLAVEFGPPSSLTLKAGWELLHRMDQSLFCQAVLMPLMTDHRILAQVAGHRQDVIKLIPPLVLSAADADEIIAAMDTSVAACHRFPGPVWEVGRQLGKAALKRFESPRQNPQPVGSA